MLGKQAQEEGKKKKKILYNKRRQVFTLFLNPQEPCNATIYKT